MSDSCWTRMRPPSRSRLRYDSHSPSGTLAFPLRCRPSRGHFLRLGNILVEVDFLPVFTLDRDNMDLGLLCNRIDRAKIPSPRALGGVHHFFDLGGKQTRSIAPEGEKTDRLRI